VELWIKVKAMNQSWAWKSWKFDFWM